MLLGSLASHVPRSVAQKTAMGMAFAWVAARAQHASANILILAKFASLRDALATAPEMESATLRVGSADAPKATPA